MKQIPWKNLPVVTTKEYVALVYHDGSVSPDVEANSVKHYPFGNAVAWCTCDEFQEAMKSQIPEPPLPEIIKPKWADVVAVGGGNIFGTYLVYARKAANNQGDSYGHTAGPSCKTRREAIEEWNKLVGG